MAYSPSTDNYQLGKGVLYFNRLNSSGVYLGERDLGNTTAFEYSVAITKLDHYSSRGGLKAKDKEIISEITPSLSFTLDEVTKENLADLTLANLTKVTQTGGTVTGEVVTAHLGMRVKLAKRGISSVVVKDVTDTTTYTAGTDYIVSTTLKDDKVGRIYIPDTGSDISEGDVLHVSYTYATATYYTVDSFAQTQVNGMLRFVSDNPAGQDMEVQIWSVSLTPNGNTAMIGDAWSTLGFTGEILKDETNHPNTPYMQIIMEYA